MKNVMKNYLSPPALGVLLFLSGSGVSFAQSAVDIQTLGIGPTGEVICENVTNPQVASASLRVANQWSCNDAGMTFSPGDQVKLTITGDVLDNLFVGSMVMGIEPQSSVVCDNQTSLQVVSINAIVPEWNCVDAGLLVNSGDIVVQSVSGIVAVGGAGNAPPTMFDHTLIVDQACSDCHVKPPTHLNSGNNCEACHTINSWLLGPDPIQPPPVLPCDIIDPNLINEPCMPVDPLPPIEPCGVMGPVTGNTPCLPVEPPLIPCGLDGGACVPPQPPIEPCGVIDPVIGNTPCLPVEPPLIPCGPDGGACVPPQPPIEPCGVIDPVTGNTPCLPVEPPLIPCGPDGGACVPPLPPVEPCGVIDPTIPGSLPPCVIPEPCDPTGLGGDICIQPEPCPADALDCVAIEPSLPPAVL